MDSTTAIFTVLQKKPVVVYVGTNEWENLREKILNGNIEGEGTRSPPEVLNFTQRIRSN